MALPLLNENAATSDMAEPFKTLGKFHLVERLGQGGMGEVFLGVEVGTLQQRAIKVLLPEWTRRPRGVESFRREAEIGKQLGLHPGIVAVHGIHEALVGDPACPESVLFLELDFVDGVNLRQLTDRYFRTMGEHLPIRCVVHILRAVLRAVDVAHTHAIGDDALRVVHGDINPGNVLISSRGDIRVTDFGIARFAPEPAFISRPVGTRPYMAPEQYLGRICPQNDLYAIGALLHELLTGEPPLVGGTPLTFERQLFHDPVPPLGRNDVPAALERLRRGLLEKKVELRIPTAAKALALLATVDRSDCQDELRATYRRLIGPPRSRLTKYLRVRGDGTAAFVADLLRRHGRPVTGEVLGSEPAHVERHEAPAPAPATSVDELDSGMPWLADDEDSIATQEQQRSGPRLSPTIRLDLPVGDLLPFTVGSTPTVPEPANEASPTAGHDPSAEASDRLPAAGPLLEPMEDESDLDALVTAPRPAATPAGKPGPAARRYPPRPPHLEDGAPFQRRRPKREVSAAPDGAQPNAATRASAGAASPSKDPTARPEHTQPQRSPETRPDAIPATHAVPRPPARDPSARWKRSLGVTMTALLLAACGVGVLIGLALTQPPEAVAPSNHTHSAPAATTDD